MSEEVLAHHIYQQTAAHGKVEHACAFSSRENNPTRRQAKERKNKKNKRMASILIRNHSPGTHKYQSRVIGCRIPLGCQSRRAGGATTPSFFPHANRGFSSSVSRDTRVCTRCRKPFAQTGTVRQRLGGTDPEGRCDSQPARQQLMGGRS